MANYRNRGAGGKTKGAWRESQKGEGWRERGEGGGRRRVEFGGVKEVGSACSFTHPFSRRRQYPDVICSGSGVGSVWVERLTGWRAKI